MQKVNFASAKIEFSQRTAAAWQSNQCETDQEKRTSRLSLPLWREGFRNLPPSIGDLANGCKKDAARGQVAIERGVEAGILPFSLTQ
jgi:hypothetical protein